MWKAGRARPAEGHRSRCSTSAPREDHVVDDSSSRTMLGAVSSRDIEERMLTDSYHVATLDNEAEIVFAESADFVARVTT